MFLAGLASQGFAEALRGEHDEPPAMLSSDPSTPTTTKGTSLMIMIPTSINEDTRTSWRWIGLHGVDDREQPQGGVRRDGSSALRPGWRADGGRVRSGESAPRGPAAGDPHHPDMLRHPALSSRMPWVLTASSIAAARR